MSNSTGDIATQIKAMFNRRKDLIKEKKKKKILLVIAIVALVLAGGFGIYSKIMSNNYSLKLAELDQEKEMLLKQKEVIESQISNIEIEKEKATDELLEKLTEAEMVAQNNLYLVEQNIKLQNFIKEAAKAGVKPQNYGTSEIVTDAVDYSKLEYLGEFEGTAYTPTKEECGNDLGITASGKPIIPGVSVAVDTNYWKMGTKFYIEGLGYVVAMDTGGAIKGKYRFDYAVFDRDYAKQLGRRKYKVYLVKEENE